MSAKLMIHLVITISFVTRTTTGQSQNPFLLVISSSLVEYNTTIVSSAVSSAISLINNNRRSHNSVTGEYSPLDYVEEDGLCNKQRTGQILRQYIHDDALLAIIGCGCSNATMAISNVPQLLNRNVPVISYGSPSTKLSDSIAYPTLFRTTPTFDGISHAMAQLSKEFNWKQMLLITEEINIDPKVFNNFLSMKRIKLFKKSVESADIFETNNRVVIIDAYGPKTRNVLCQAYKNSVYYPGYAWFIHDNFIEDDWYTVPDTNCTIDEMRRVLNHSIVISTSPRNGKTDIFSYAHDAVTAIAVAQDKQKADSTKSLIDVLRTISFKGLSGNVSFTSINESDAVIEFTQLESRFNNYRLTENVVAIYAQGNLNITTSTSEIWPLGVPNDGITIIVIESVMIWAFVSAILLSIIGMGFTAFCFIFIFIYRKTKVIKLTSPNLNYLLLLGSVSVFLSIILYGYPSTDRHVFDVICPIQPFFGSILGYDMCVTIATVKMWRIYHIFKGPHPSQRIPKDWQLMLVIATLLSIDSLISILLIVIDVIWFPPMLIHENKPDEVDPLTGEVESFYFWDCRYSTYIFTLVALVHNFIVHGIGIVFAFRIRKIGVTVLNEYRYNLAILVISVVITFITVLCLYAIGPDPSLYTFFYSLLVSIGCVSFLALTFIPKMIALKQDPNGDNIFQDNIASNGLPMSDGKPKGNDSAKPPSDDQE